MRSRESKDGTESTRIDQKLVEMSTRWSLVELLKSPEDAGFERASGEVAQRYARPLLRYAVAITKDVDTASDIVQELLLRLCEGKLKPQPDKGSFRKYLKAVLVNLTREMARKNKAINLPPNMEIAAAPKSDSSELDVVWREELIEHVWQRLRHEKPVYHDVLLAKVDDPELTSRQVGEQLQISAPNVRKTIQRAHAKFAELVVREVAESERLCDPEDLRAELVALDLLKYCESAFETWKQRQLRKPRG